MYYFPPKINNPIFTATVNNFLTKKEIDYLLNNLQNIPYSQGGIGEKDEFDNHELFPRKSKVKWIPYEDKFLHFYKKTVDIISFYNTRKWKFKLKSTLEPFQYTEYNSSYKGKYDWHVDIGPGKISNRKISVTIQLSDPSQYEGGSLELYDCFTSSLEGFPVKQAEKQLGSITLFPSYIPHRVTPVTRGIRKSLVLWVGGCTFK